MYIKKAKRVEILFRQHVIISRRFNIRILLFPPSLSFPFTGPDSQSWQPQNCEGILFDLVISILWMQLYQLKITLIIFQSSDHIDHNHSPVTTIEYCHHQLPINWIWQITKRVSKITSVQNGIFLLDAFKMASDGKPGYDSRFSPDTLTKLALKVPWSPRPWWEHKIWIV